MYTGQVTISKVPEKTRPCLTGHPVPGLYRSWIFLGDIFYFLSIVYNNTDDYIADILNL